jgi:hypothetical protein
MTPVQKLLGLLALAVMLVAGSGAVNWQVQDWRYGKQLAEQARLRQDDLTAISSAAANQLRADQGRRIALEQRLSASDQSHHKELTDAQTIRLASAIALPLLIYGCQFFSTPRIQPVAAHCQPVPPPATKD